MRVQLLDDGLHGYQATVRAEPRGPASSEPSARFPIGRRARQSARPPRLGCSAPLRCSIDGRTELCSGKGRRTSSVVGFFCLFVFYVTHRRETEKQLQTGPCCFRVVSVLLAGSSSSSPELSWVSSLRAAVTSGSDDAIAAF